MKAHSLSLIWRKRSRPQFSAPIKGGWSSSTDVRVNSSVAASVSGEDMSQTSVIVSSDVGIQPANSCTVALLCFNESKARDFEKMTDLVVDCECISRKTEQGIGAKVS